MFSICLKYYKNNAKLNSMIVTFCGHAEIFFRYKDKLKAELLEYLKKIGKNETITFYMGGYGEFDQIALNCAVAYKKIKSDNKIVFITPYLDDKYLKNKLYLNNCYDEIIYPEIERVPKKYAIIERNKWMVEKCDLLIAFVRFKSGGAYQTLEYAKKRKKRFINLYNKSYDELKY